MLAKQSSEASIGADAGVVRAPGRVPLTWRRFRYPQSLYKYVAVLVTLALIAYSLDYLKIPLERLPGVLGRMGEMLARRYFPPLFSLFPFLAARWARVKLTTRSISSQGAGFPVQISNCRAA